VNPADRKKQLIAQGAVHRAEVLHAKQTMRAGLRPDSLARGALRQLAGVVLAVVGKKTGIGLAGAGAQTLLPLLLSAGSALLRNKSLRKPLLRGALIAGSVATAAVFFSKKKKASSEDPGAQA